MLLQFNNPFLPLGSLSKDKHRTLNPVKGVTTPLQTYTKALDSNLQILKLKYPFKEASQLKQLLEQLQNDLATVVDIIESQNNQIQKPDKVQILEVEEEEDKQKAPESDVSMTIMKVDEETQKDILQSENKLLKRSFLKLYYKFEKMREELNQKEKQLEISLAEMHRLNTINELLKHEKINEKEDEELKNRYIC